MRTLPPPPLLLPLPELFWHTTPLHYAPFLLHSGALYSQARLLSLGLPLQPRVTAAKRDRKLGLSDYVHLSFLPKTPLLAHKRSRGYPHVLLAFSASVADLPGAAIVRYNHKAWRHRDDFIPLTEAGEKAAFWEEWRAGRFPSAELVVRGELALAPHAQTLFTANKSEDAWLRRLLEQFPPPSTSSISISQKDNLFPPSPLTADLTEFETYTELCVKAGKLLAPPAKIPFD